MGRLLAVLFMAAVLAMAVFLFHEASVFLVFAIVLGILAWPTKKYI